MELYIYDTETKEIAGTVTGETNEECEKKATEANWDLDLYGWTYNKNGLN